MTSYLYHAKRLACRRLLSAGSLLAVLFLMVGCSASGSGRDAGVDGATDAGRDAGADGMIDDGQDSDGDGGTPTVTCEVLVVGGSLGGVAAAHEAASAGADTCLVSLFDWLGGQISSQGTSALDEGYSMFSKPYAELRSSIWNYYVRTHDIDPAFSWQGDEPYNAPGMCWVSHLCFEPAVGAQLVNQLLQPLVVGVGQTGLHIFRGYRPLTVERIADTVVAVDFESEAGLRLRFEAQQIIDATELGDLLPLAGAAYRVGAEARAQTAEPDAPEQAAPECVQPFTYTFALELRPEGEDNRIAEPPGYDSSYYSVEQGNNWGVFDSRKWPGFETNYGFAYSFWDYRRILSADTFLSGVDHDVAMINWGGNPHEDIPGGNDFNQACGSDGCNIIDKPAEVAERILQRAREYTLGFAYYLQNDVPRDDGSGFGYPNLLLRTDIMGTVDGISKFPYIRESRRLEALSMVREQDAASMVQSPQPPFGPGQYRAVTRYPDSIAIARYGFDLHHCATGPVFHPQLKMGAAQVPLGALIPVGLDGLLAGDKNIGVTHIANGGYRLHPTEWSIGQAAGAAAALAVEAGVQPRQIRDDERLLRKLQLLLVEGRAGPIYWWNDPGSALVAGKAIARDDPAWVAAQMVAVAGLLIGDETPAFYPDGTLTRGQAGAIIHHEAGLALVSDCNPTFNDVPCDHPFYGAIEALARLGVTAGCGGGLYCVDDTITRGQFITFLVKTDCVGNPSCPPAPPAVPSFSDVSLDHPFYRFIEAALAGGLLDGDPGGNVFDPAGTTTRRSLAIWLFNHMRLRLGI